jgi:hypothetical protein
MKRDEEAIGTAIRMEYSEIDGKLFIVFEITSERHRQRMMREWCEDIEFRIVGKDLVPVA